MTNYQFRTNWRGKLILQRLVKYRDQFGGPDYQWEDATVTDLKDYYAELCKLQNAPLTQELRRRFDAESG